MVTRLHSTAAARGGPAAEPDHAENTEGDLQDSGFEEDIAGLGLPVQDEPQPVVDPVLASGQDSSRNADANTDSGSDQAADYRGAAADIVSDDLVPVPVSPTHLSAEAHRLMHAAEHGVLSVVRELLEDGFTGDQLNVDLYGSGETALHLASQMGHADVVALLIRAGASVESEMPGDGVRPIHYAVSYGHYPVVRLLVEEGNADLTSTASEHYNTVLHVAALNGQALILKYLLYTAHCDLFVMAASGESALDLAVKEGFVNAAEVIVRYIQDRVLGGARTWPTGPLGERTEALVRQAMHVAAGCSRPALHRCRTAMLALLMRLGGPSLPHFKYYQCARELDAEEQYVKAMRLAWLKAIKERPLEKAWAELRAAEEKQRAEIEALQGKVQHLIIAAATLMKDAQQQQQQQQQTGAYGDLPATPAAAAVCDQGPGTKPAAKEANKHKDGGKRPKRQDVQHHGTSDAVAAQAEPPGEPSATDAPRHQRQQHGNAGAPQACSAAAAAAAQLAQDASAAAAKKLMRKHKKKKREEQSHVERAGSRRASSAQLPAGVEQAQPATGAAAPAVHPATAPKGDRPVGSSPKEVARKKRKRSRDKVRDPAAGTGAGDKRQRERRQGPQAGAGAAACASLAQTQERQRTRVPAAAGLASADNSQGMDEGEPCAAGQAPQQDVSEGEHTLLSKLKKLKHKMRQLKQAVHVLGRHSGTRGSQGTEATREREDKKKKRGKHKDSKHTSRTEVAGTQGMAAPVTTTAAGKATKSCAPRQEPQTSGSHRHKKRKHTWQDAAAAQAAAAATSGAVPGVGVPLQELPSSKVHSHKKRRRS